LGAEFLKLAGDETLEGKLLKGADFLRSFYSFEGRSIRKSEAGVPKVEFLNWEDVTKVSYTRGLSTGY
jgi:hypothetical protein